MSTSPLRIEYLAVAALSPYAGNARTHSAEQISQLAAVIRLAGLDDQARRALSLADNKLALNAGWDEKLLVAELAGLGGELQELTGFSEDELVRLLHGRQGLTDPDEAPPVPATPVTQRGDLWRLGPHRLLCGDATSAGDVAAALGGVAPHLMVTDPPYGVEYDPNWRMEAAKKGLIGFSPSALGAVLNDGRIDWSDAYKLFPGDVAYLWHAGRHASVVQTSIEAAGFNIRCQVIWAKSSFAISRGNYNWQHEPCWYAVRQKKTAHWHGDHSQTTLWHIPHNRNETGHSTQKPIECMRRPIENNSSAGQAVYDPFLGSGTTLIAAEIMGRVCHGIEIDPGYCDVAVTRWENFTGRKAERMAHEAAA